jgi:hypothetical protein
VRHREQHIVDGPVGVTVPTAVLVVAAHAPPSAVDSVAIAYLFDPPGFAHVDGAGNGLGELAHPAMSENVTVAALHAAPAGAPHVHALQSRVSLADA